MTSEQQGSGAGGLRDIEILIVSLARASERRRLMRAQLELPGMPAYRFIDALDARANDESSLRRLSDDAASVRQVGRKLTGGEIACTYSHTQAYEHMLAKRLPAAVILEDDALLSHQFTAVLERLLPKIDPTKPQVVLLSHVERYSAWGGIRVDRLRRLYRPYEAYGGHAYVITAAGAKSLLAGLRPVHTLADDWTYFAKAGLVQVLGLVPYLVGTSVFAGQSQIGAERFEVRAASRVPGWFHRYVWQKFLFQIFVKPLLRLRRVRNTW